MSEFTYNKLVYKQKEVISQNNKQIQTYRRSL